MNIEQVKEIANAVLYEGYLLYPYRPSAIKNRQRWMIGVIYPRAYSEANGDIDPWTMKTECLFKGRSDQIATLAIHVRFLHLLLRTSDQSAREMPACAQPEALQEQKWSPLHQLASEPCEEGIEREISISDVAVPDLVAHPRVVAITFPDQHIVEDGLVREQHAIAGCIRLSAELLADDLFKLCVQIENTTPATGTMLQTHREAVLQSFVSTHTILQGHEGEFISLLEPPAALQAATSSCQNLRTWPVLAGNPGDTDTLLSSPIILYDYPQIAPESPGNLFDGTEIDELLTLRILTLTEEEKEQMRQGDERVRELLQRTEALTPEQLMKLHGTIRSLRPVDQGESV